MQTVPGWIPAFNHRKVSEQLTAASGLGTEVVHVVVGGCKNEILNQFTADARGLPVLAGPEEATAAGNLMVQALGLGLIHSMADVLPLIRGALPIREYQPQDTAAWDAA